MTLKYSSEGTKNPLETIYTYKEDGKPQILKKSDVNTYVAR